MVTTRREDGFTLTEMLIVVGLLGVALTVVFGSIQVLTKSAAVTMEENAAAHDLSYSMEVLSKTLMAGKVLYANDHHLVILDQRSNGSWEVSSIIATAGAGAASGRGRLIWERWGSDPSGSAPVGGDHTVWVMSERNVNRSTTPEVPLFAYYRDATEAGRMGSVDKGTGTDASVSAFLGPLPAGYTASAVGRIRLHVATAFNAGVRDDSRDIVLRQRGGQ